MVTDIDSARMSHHHPLRYVDFICSEEVMRPIIAQVEKELGIPIIYIAADPERSGPKEDYAVNCFATNQADIGRI